MSNFAGTDVKSALECCKAAVDCHEVLDIIKGATNRLLIFSIVDTVSKATATGRKGGITCHYLTSKHWKLRGRATPPFSCRPFQVMGLERCRKSQMLELRCG